MYYLIHKNQEKKKKQQPLLEPSILSFASVKCAVPIETSTGNDLT